MSIPLPDATKQIERLSHLQQRIANVAAVSQARGITTWIIVGSMAALVQVFIRPELGESQQVWLVHVEYGLAFTSFIFMALCIFGVLNEVLRRRGSVEIIAPPRLLTLHFSMNALSAILAIMLIALSTASFRFGTRLPAGWLIGVISISAFMIYAHLRENRRKDSEEVFPGLHPFSLKFIYRRAGFARRKLVLLLIFLVLLFVSAPMVVILVYWFKGLTNDQGTLLVKSPMTLYFLALLGLIAFVLAKESSFREIKSIKALERLIAIDPAMSEIEFGFFVRATSSAVSSIIYTKILDKYLAEKLISIQALHDNTRRHVETLLADPKNSELLEAHLKLVSNYELRVMAYTEVSMPLMLWIERYLGQQQNYNWDKLLTRERERSARIAVCTSSLNQRLS